MYGTGRTCAWKVATAGHCDVHVACNTPQYVSCKCKSSWFTHKKYVKAEHRISLRWPADVQRKIFVEVEAVQKERHFFPTDDLWRVYLCLIPARRQSVTPGSAYLNVICRPIRRTVLLKTNTSCKLVLRQNSLFSTSKIVYAAYAEICAVSNSNLNCVKRHSK
jgi:hypothetical protein